MAEHDGHRRRMRERLLKNGLNGFAPHEALEVILYNTHARGDTSALARRLLSTFGSFKNVLEARPEQLMRVEGVGEQTAVMLASLLHIFRYYQVCVCQEQRTIANYQDAERYCAALLAGWRTEQFYVVCLNAARQLLGHRLVTEGSLSEVAAYPRIVAEAALNYNAHSVLLCHNHPSGRCLPSEEDVAITRRLQTMLSLMDIRLMDHIIVAGGSTYSMTMHGDLTGGAFAPEPGLTAADRRKIGGVRLHERNQHEALEKREASGRDADAGNAGAAGRDRLPERGDDGGLANEARAPGGKL